jgi:hypothetical protein
MPAGLVDQKPARLGLRLLEGTQEIRHPSVTPLVLVRVHVGLHPQKDSLEIMEKKYLAAMAYSLHRRTSRHLFISLTSDNITKNSSTMLTSSELEKLVDFLADVHESDIGKYAGHLLVIISSSVKKSSNLVEDLDDMLNASNLAARYFSIVDGTTCLKLFNKEMSAFPPESLYWKAGSRVPDAKSYREASAAVRERYPGCKWADRIAATYGIKEEKCH